MLFDWFLRGGEDDLMLLRSNPDELCFKCTNLCKYGDFLNIFSAEFYLCLELFAVFFVSRGILRNSSLSSDNFSPCASKAIF